MTGSHDAAENFLRRWSRRKQAAGMRVRETAARTPVSAQTPPQADAGPGPSSGDVPREVARPAVDPASLPPVETITAASDVRAFLAAGVPEAISRAALRRAWVTDPVIRDFVGLAENQWDFTKPDGVPGFGTLDFTPELRRMVADLVRAVPAKTEPARSAAVEAITPGEASSALTPGKTDKTATSDVPARDVARGSAPAQEAGPHADDTALAGSQRCRRPFRRRHGHAVPE
ncbi:MAG: DUF3306 domain-containing protein [Bradyrhizobiaceae bacterium]|nr:DUF3306 domain-containing protein [Bradyrhizobiaceae bacterium]